ncbi:MAG: hypothetical protein NVS1B6_09330 [Steroidobacteraceae bacterium]
MSVVKPSYLTKTNLTITLASLAASATVGRQSTAIDNTTDLALDCLVAGVVEVGVVAANNQVLFFVAGSIDAGTTYSGKNGANVVGATDAAFTRADPTDLKLIGVLPCPTASVIMSWGPYSIAQAFGGQVPQRWVLIVCNDTGVALSATAGNNAAWYMPIQTSIV